MSYKNVFTFSNELVLSEATRVCINTWRLSNPDFDVKVYNLGKFIMEFENTSIIKTYQRIRDETSKIRYISLCLIEKYGGIWINNHVIMINSLSNVFECKNYEYLSEDDTMKIIYAKDKNDYFIGLLKTEFEIIVNTNSVSSNNPLFEISLKNALTKIGYSKTTETKQKSIKIDDVDLFKTKIDHTMDKIVFIESGKNDILDLINRKNDLTDTDKNICVPGSIMDKYIKPYYKKCVLIRTHNPSDTMIDRIVNIYEKCYDRHVIVSLHLSMKSYVVSKLDMNSNVRINEVSCCNEREIVSKMPEMVKNNCERFVSQGDRFYQLKVTHKGLLNDHDNIQNKNHNHIQNMIYSLRDNIRKILAIFTEGMHIYTDEDIKRIYGDSNIKSWGNFNIAWNHHNECMAHAVMNNGWRYFDRLWILEDDLEYTGDILEFMKLHDSYDFDLLGFDLCKENQLIGSFNQKFINEIFNKREKIKYKEFITCLSGKFLKELLRLISEGYNGHSEVTTPMLCKYLNMKYMDISKVYHSQQLEWILIGSNTMTSVKKLVAFYKKRNRKVFVHPCKY
jgi:hypothetical protein